jgi:hypothetical protein
MSVYEISYKEMIPLYGFYIRMKSYDILQCGDG